MIDTLAKFDALMLKYNVSSDYRTDVSNPIETPDIDHLFHGTDFHCRAYVNLPIVVASEFRFLGSNQDRMTAGLKPRENLQKTAFVVFQRYTDSDIFVLGGEPRPMDADEPLGTDHRDLSLVEDLLAGKTVRFHDWRYEHGDCIVDPDNWIDVALDMSWTSAAT